MKLGTVNFSTQYAKHHYTQSLPNDNKGFLLQGYLTVNILASENMQQYSTHTMDTVGTIVVRLVEELDGTE